MIDKEKIGQRILTLRKKLDLNQISFSESISITQQALSQIEKGQSLPSLELINKITSKYGISYSYLIEGKEELKVLQEPLVKYEKNNIKHYDSPKVVTVNEQGNPNIVMLDSKAAAGLPANIDNPEYFKNLPAFSLPGNQFRGGTFIAIQVSGESMTRTLYHGDWLIAKFLENPVDNIRNGYIHVVVKQDGVVVKRLLNRVKERGTIVLQSDNSEFYPTYEDNIEDIIQIYEVKARLTFLMPNINLDMRKDINDLQIRVGRLEQKFPNGDNNHHI